jgi:hypothetical protein
VPEINSENLLVLLAPLVIVYGVSFFITLLDQMNLPALEFRFLLIVVGSVIACLPIFLVFLPPRPSPLAFPPYMPPVVQTVSGWVNHEELIMSDVPWAVAWYGHKQSVWLTLKSVPERDDPFTHEDFFSINDYMKPISVLYLTPQTMDSRFLTQWVMAGERSWGRFILEALVNKEVPKHFPLYKMQRGWLPFQAMLADRERWPSETSKETPAAKP